MEKEITKDLQEHFQLITTLKENISTIKKIIHLIIKTLKRGGKIILCGNGGSAADAQHIAGEFVGRFYKKRKPLASIALNTNTSIITAIGNDFSFEEIFSRQVEALGKKEDLLIVISTSGNSLNLIKAVEKAKKKQIKTAGLLGKDGGLVKKKVDIALVINSNSTARIQEAHILIGHILCKLSEKYF